MATTFVFCSSGLVLNFHTHRKREPAKTVAKRILTPFCMKHLYSSSDSSEAQWIIMQTLYNNGSTNGPFGSSHWINLEICAWHSLWSSRVLVLQQDKVVSNSHKFTKMFPKQVNRIPKRTCSTRLDFHLLFVYVCLYLWNHETSRRPAFSPLFLGRCINEW
jgi:hypothetical protein